MATFKNPCQNLREHIRQYFERTLVNQNTPEFLLPIYLKFPFLQPFKEQMFYLPFYVSDIRFSLIQERMLRHFSSLFFSDSEKRKLFSLKPPSSISLSPVFPRAPASNGPSLFHEAYCTERHSHLFHLFPHLIFLFPFGDSSLFLTS